VLENQSEPVQGPAWHSVVEAEQQIFQMINDDRGRAGLPLLLFDERLTAVARAHCSDMEQFHYIAHISPRTGNPSDRVKRAGIVASRVSENLVKAPEPYTAHRQLMESPGHRASILDPAVRYVGIGAVQSTNPDGKPWLLITEVFAAIQR
jgi:uncharacterized protein YkwD